MVPHYILVAPPDSQPSGRPYYGLNRNVPASEALSPEGRAVWEEEREAFEDNDEWCLFFDSLETAIEYRQRYAHVDTHSTCWWCTHAKALMMRRCLRG